MNVKKILDACKTFGGELTATEGGNLNWKGPKPPDELARVIKLHKEKIWSALPPPELPEKDASMMHFLRNLIGRPDVIVWRGERFDVGDIAKRLVTMTHDEAWYSESGKLWLAWMAEDSAWYADLDSMLLCERVFK